MRFSLATRSFFERVALELACALAREREARADLLERALGAAAETEAKADDLRLALGQLGEERLRLDAELALRDDLVGRRSRGVDDEVAEVGAVAVALPTGVSRLTGCATTSSARRTCSSGRPVRVASSSGVAVRPGLALEAVLRAPNALDGAREVDGEADHLALIGERAAERMTNPPRRVGAEAQAAPMVELVDRAKETEVALLDQIDERHAAIATRERDDDAQVRLDELGRDALALASRDVDLARACDGAARCEAAAPRARRARATSSRTMRG